MKKTTLLTTSLICLSLLAACSTKDKMPAKRSEQSSSKSQMMTDKKDHMSKDHMKGHAMKDSKDHMKGHMSKEDKEKKGMADSMDKDKMSKDKMAHAEGKQLNEGKPAPDFELMGVNGKTYKLSDFKGKKVYLKFWASWCSICLSTLGDAQKLATAKDRDYEVLTVVSPKHNGEKSEEGFKKWFAGTDYKNLPTAMDPSGQLLNKYGVRSYPTGVFIGSDGVLVKKHVGFMKKSDIEKTLKSIK